MKETSYIGWLRNKMKKNWLNNPAVDHTFESGDIVQISGSDFSSDPGRPNETQTTNNWKALMFEELLGGRETFLEFIAPPWRSTKTNSVLKRKKLEFFTVHICNFQGEHLGLGPDLDPAKSLDPYPELDSKSPNPSPDGLEPVFLIRSGSTGSTWIWASRIRIH